MNRKFHFTKATQKRLTDYVRDQASVPQETARPAIPLVSACLTHQGKMRPTNQDTLIVDEALRLYGVADGMGGHRGGETASAGARDAVLRSLQAEKPALEAMRKAVEGANTELFAQQAADAKLAGMGTTLTMLWMSDSFAYIAHVGDSRVYVLREGKLQQMTDDHSMVAELVRLGQLTAEEAERHPFRNVITRAVGTEEGIQVDLAVEERMPGDTWLICSDGLYGMVADAEIEKTLQEHAAEQAAELLLDAALEAGGRDNISVIVLHDEEGAR
ncbi:MAG: Stp1/IreP family PP2C-type Ser/Thr phosphatase [Clostridia bacterium]|nr:Stp1/IreP family PP2C-type Ser/Thr phosphatase [Clostridia bacterium]